MTSFNFFGSSTTAQTLAAGETGFIGDWLGRLLYWDFTPAAFTLLYVALVLLAVWLWRWIPPQAP